MKTNTLLPYEAPSSGVFEVRGNRPLLTSTLDALAVEAALGGIDEITFTDFSQTF